MRTRVAQCLFKSLCLKCPKAGKLWNKITGCPFLKISIFSDEQKNRFEIENSIPKRTDATQDKVGGIGTQKMLKKDWYYYIQRRAYLRLRKKQTSFKPTTTNRFEMGPLNVLNFFFFVRTPENFFLGKKQGGGKSPFWPPKKTSKKAPWPPFPKKPKKKLLGKKKLESFFFFGIGGRFWKNPLVH